MLSRTELHFLQSDGPEHLLIFPNLQRVGLLTEQAPGETLTAMENKVSDLVMDKPAGEQTAQVNPSLPLLPTSIAPWESRSGNGERLLTVTLTSTASASRGCFQVLNTHCVLSPLDTVSYLLLTKFSFVSTYR